MSSNGYDSPTSVEAPLEYITVDNYEWPKPPAPKRARLDEQERRRRHTECQKRFLKRKRQQLEQLREDVVKLNLQVKLLEATREASMLQTEQDDLRNKISGITRPCLPPTTPNNEDALLESFLLEIDEEVLSVLPAEDTFTELDFQW